MDDTYTAYCDKEPLEFLIERALLRSHIDLSAGRAIVA